MVSGPHSPARPLTEDRSRLFQRCHLLFTLLVLFCHLDDLLVASVTICQHAILDIAIGRAKISLVTLIELWCTAAHLLLAFS